MKKFYAILNALVTLGMIGINYVAGSQGINGNTVGSISEKYDTLFTPAGYAFSIWGLIFLLLLYHAYYQLKCAFWDTRHNDFLRQMGPWLIIANLANAAWLFAWLYEWTGLSVLLMFVILGSLIALVIKLNMERWDAPFVVIRSIWWPIVFYFGWISVATIANVAAWLVKLGWHDAVNEVGWTIGMIAIATLLNLAMLALRSMREYVAVGMWALLAIAVRHWTVHPELAVTALVAVALLGLASTIHAVKHWDTNPLNKVLKRRL